MHRKSWLLHRPATRRAFLTVLVVLPPALQADPKAEPASAAAAGIATTDTPVLLVLGDSLSAGFGLSPGQGWVDLLAGRLAGRVRVVNASLSGETSSGGLSRLPGLLARERPRWVVLGLGANDGLRGLPLAGVEQRLSAMVQQAQAAGATVVLLGQQLPPNYGPAYSDGFSALFGRVAQRTQAALVPFLLADVADRPDRMQADGLHPTAAAQPLILETVWLTLGPTLPPPTDPRN